MNRFAPTLNKLPQAWNRPRPTRDETTARPDVGQRYRTILFGALVGLGCAGIGAALILLAYRPDELTRHLAVSLGIISFALAGRVASGPQPAERKVR